MLEDLGNLGDFLGGIGVVVTLIYLAHQIRQNTKQIRQNTTAVNAEAHRARREGASAVNLAIAQDAELAALFRSGLGNFKALAPDQHTQFSFLLAEVVIAQEAAWDEITLGTLAESGLPIVEDALSRFLGTPGGRDWWAMYRMGYPVDFRGFVDRLVASTSVHPAAKQSAPADSAGAE